MNAHRGRQYLGLDLGTTCWKALLVDDAGDVIASASSATPFVATEAGRIELSVDGFRQALDRLLESLARKTGGGGFGRVAGVSYSSQANSFALLDASGEPLTPIISWTDARARREPVHERLNKLHNRHAITGVPSLDGEFAVAKLRWLAAHQPDVVERARRIEFLDSLLSEYLTGAATTESALAMLTGIAERDAVRWWPAALDSLDLPQLAWPTIRRAGAETASIAPALAARFAFDLATRVYTGCLDQCAGAIGVGAVTSDAMAEATGTVLAVTRYTADAPCDAADVFRVPTFEPLRWIDMAFSNTSANLLEYYRSEHAPDKSFDELLELASRARAAIRIGRSEVAADLSTAFPDDVASCDVGEIVLGILDCVNDELARLVERVGAAGGEIRSAGGGARSRFWLQRKADRLGVRVLTTASDEPACYGAAILAAAGVSRESVAEVCKRWITVRDSFEPRRQREERCSHVSA